MPARPAGEGAARFIYQTMGQAITRHRTAGLSSPMSRRFPFPRWKPWGRVLTAEEVEAERWRWAE